MLPASALVALLVGGTFAWPGSRAVDAHATDGLTEGGRLRAIEQLAARAGADATAILVPLLHDPDPGVRLYAARRLLRSGAAAAVDAALSWIWTPAIPQIDRPFGLDVLRDAPVLPPAARPALEMALRDPDPAIRILALDVLERREVGTSLPEVLALLDDDNREVRLRAVGLAGTSGDPRAAPPLLARLEDSDRQIRLDAIRALGSQPKALPALLRVVADGPEEARLAAIDALGALRMEAATAPLGDLARRHPADELARHAVLALGSLATPSAVAVLVSLTRSPPVIAETLGALRRAGPSARPALERALETGSPSSVAAAATVLSDLGDRRAAAPLATAIDRRPDLAPILLEAARRLPDPALLGALARAAEAADPDTRRRAIDALGASGDPRAIVVLERGLRDPDARVRESAARLAEAIGAGDATSALLGLVVDGDRAVRRTAAAALGRIGAPSHAAVAALVTSITRPGGPPRDDDEWTSVGAALERLSDADDVDRLAAAFVGARGSERLALARGLSAVGAARPIRAPAVIDGLVGALADGGATALAAADALAVSRVPDGRRAALAAAFFAAEPAVRARLCPALAMTSDGGSWLGALIAARDEPSEVRAAAAWAARGTDEGQKELAKAMATAATGDGPIAANVRAARDSAGWPWNRRFTDITVRNPTGGAEVGRWVSVSGPDGVAVWATTDAAGAVRLQGLPEGPLLLRVEGARLQPSGP